MPSGLMQVLRDWGVSKGTRRKKLKKKDRRAVAGKKTVFLKNHTHTYTPHNRHTHAHTHTTHHTPHPTHTQRTHRAHTHTTHTAHVCGGCGVWCVLGMFGIGALFASCEISHTRVREKEQKGPDDQFLKMSNCPARPPSLLSGTPTILKSKKYSSVQCSSRNQIITLFLNIINGNFLL